MTTRRPIPVIDLFAGPGGLGEGFSAFRADARRAFRSVLSIEKDAAAHQTLRLRSFYRQFDRPDVPDAYYQLLRGEITLQTLYDAWTQLADGADMKSGMRPCRQNTR